MDSASNLSVIRLDHYIVYLAISMLYSVFAFWVFRTIFKKSLWNKISAYIIGFLFAFLAVFFYSHAVHARELSEFDHELVSILMASIPPIIFILFRRHSIIFNDEGVKASYERFNKLKDEFLSVASHELRTPLSVINGFAEILLREKLGPMNDEQKRRVRKILMQGQRLNRIVDELLDLSRIRSGKVEVRKDIFDLVPVLKACLDDHLIVCEQQKIVLRDMIPDVLPDVVGDIERVTQVVVNLLNNAIKYTEPGGTVNVNATHDKVRREIKVEISDTGIGIDVKDQKHVFEEFYRVNHLQARKYSGSGLGLAIVKQLVEAQNGHVGLYSEGTGKGSTFYFTLPESKSCKEKTIDSSKSMAR